jgi:DNA polymerase III delta subunit
MVISDKKTTVWDLADILATRKSAKALEFLDRLLRDGEEPLSMVGALAWMFRKLIEASELKGVSNGYQAARVLNMNPQQAELALQASRKIPKAQLLAGLRALQRADDRLKGGAQDVRAVMEFLVSELSTGAVKAATN